MKARVILAATLAALATPGCGSGQPAAAAPVLALERTIPLPGVHGRIDHLAIDLERRHLFVAEVAQGAVDEVDLDAGKVVGHVSGLPGPQGVGWLPQQREFVVACAGDGTVRFFDADRREVARIALGGDADNVRIDPRNGHVVVGYGDGGLAVIDPVLHRLLGRVALPAHPEGFQLAGARAFVNLPNDGSVTVADIDRQTVLTRWRTGWHRLNFPMALSSDDSLIAIAYRFPAAIATIDAATGKTIYLSESCGDADDIFWRGDKLLAICGAGRADVIRHGESIAGLATGKGARTGLFVPDMDRLLVAVPANAGSARILVLKPLETSAQVGG